MRAKARTRRLSWVVIGLVSLLCACGDGSSVTSTPAAPHAALEWPMYGGRLERLFFNPNETAITKSTVARLVPRWRFLTGGVVMASPVVAEIEPPGEPRVTTVFVSSWDRHFYALRASDGSVVWTFEFKMQPGSAFQQSSSAAVADVDGRRVVYIASGETMYCLDAPTGELIWQFDAGTGCTTCDRQNERNEIASSPAFFDGRVYFGMDVNELPTGKGGLFALDARSGVLRWYFDVDTASTCRPNGDDAVRRFDGFHTAATLGLPDGFFATRSGCNFDRTPDGCGNIWSSPSIDVQRRMLYITSANCERPVGTTDATPTYNEAVFAVALDGTPAWVWRPREIDPRDVDFGAPPNLFTLEIGGTSRAVVGAGSKDGTYYVLDRDGVNALSHKTEPYWATNVVPGGSQGGLIAPAAVGEARILFSTAIGDDANSFADFQTPAAWGLDATTGLVAWSNAKALPSFSPTSAIPGIVFMGSILGTLYAYDSATGAQLAALRTGGALSSAAVVVDGQVYVGAGTGAHEGPPEDIGYKAAGIPNPITAFCLAGTDGCSEADKCNTGTPCTVTQLGVNGMCHSEHAPDGVACQIGTLGGTCQAGICTLSHLNCDDGNQCTRDVTQPSGCMYESEPPTTSCSVNGHIGVCRDGYCDLSTGVSANGQPTQR